GLTAPRLALFPYTTLFRSKEGEVYRLQVKQHQVYLSRLRTHDSRLKTHDSRLMTHQLCRLHPQPDRHHHQEHCKRPLQGGAIDRSEEHTSELQSRENLVCR